MCTQGGRLQTSTMHTYKLQIQINRFSMTSLCDDASTEEIHLHFLIVWYFNYLIYICAARVTSRLISH